MRIIRLYKEFIYPIDIKPTDSCHASTVLPLDNGEVLCAWFGGTKEGAEDVKIWLSKKADGIWSVPSVVSCDEHIPHWNPVLYKRDDGIIYLYYKLGHKIPEWKTMVCYSADNGDTFSAPSELVPGDIGGRGPVKNKPILFSNGSIAAPASVETSEYWRCFIDLSEDGGKSWTQAHIPMSENEEKQGLRMIQPSLWQSADGSVHCLMRTNKGYAYRSDSTDFGRTWCTSYITTVLNNNSGLDLTALADGSLVLVSNPVKGNWGKRTPLTLSVSRDNALTFEHLLTLEDTEGEFSYPAVCVKGQSLYITYTYKREQIAFVKIDFELD